MAVYNKGTPHFQISLFLIVWRSATNANRLQQSPLRAGSRARRTSLPPLAIVVSS